MRWHGTPCCLQHGTKTPPESWKAFLPRVCPTGASDRGPWGHCSLDVHLQSGRASVAFGLAFQKFARSDRPRDLSRLQEPAI